MSKVNIDYILMLVEQYHDTNCQNKALLTAIDKVVSSSIELRSKKQLIELFVASVSAATVVERDWQRFVTERKKEDLASLITSSNLRDEKTRRFMDIAFRDGVLNTSGVEFDGLLPPLSRFGGECGGSTDRVALKQALAELLSDFFEKYIGLV